MDFNRIENNLSLAYISKASGGFISRNTNLFNKIKLNDLNLTILEKSVMGTPIFKFGDKGNSILILSGIHGDELPSQLASLNLINELVNADLKDTIYVIPFAAPFATMYNKRKFKNVDLNRSSHLPHSLSGKIIQAIKELNISFVGDFHSSALNSNPGYEAVFSRRFPAIESFIIASYISQYMGSQVIDMPKAGQFYKGAIEDECNLLGIPTVTCEVVSPFGEIEKGSSEKSLQQMKTFLAYFGI